MSADCRPFRQTAESSLCRAKVTSLQVQKSRHYLPKMDNRAAKVNRSQHGGPDPSPDQTDHRETSYQPRKGSCTGKSCEFLQAPQQSGCWRLGNGILWCRKLPCFTWLPGRFRGEPSPRTSCQTRPVAVCRFHESRLSSLCFPPRALVGSRQTLESGLLLSHTCKFWVPR
jgi:hypothetical protein